jgi:hypothetical protein
MLCYVQLRPIAFFNRRRPLGVDFLLLCTYIRTSIYVLVMLRSLADTQITDRQNVGNQIVDKTVNILLAYPTT